MTPTDKLRALLDEMGVEWQDFDGEPTWMDSDGRMHYARYEFTFNGPTDELTVYHLTPEQAIAATVGTAMTLDEAIERIERFMGDYAKVLLESTLYVERDEPTDQHAFNVAERKEAQMARDLAEALATVGGYGITFTPTFDRPPETMVGETVYDAEGNAIGWIASARVEEATE